MLSLSTFNNNFSIIFFQIDSDYVGPPPPLEVTIFNINDNIDRQFLHNEIVSFNIMFSN